MSLFILQRAAFLVLIVAASRFELAAASGSRGDSDSDSSGSCECNAVSTTHKPQTCPPTPPPCATTAAPVTCPPPPEPPCVDQFSLYYFTGTLIGQNYSLAVPTDIGNPSGSGTVTGFTVCCPSSSQNDCGVYSDVRCKSQSYSMFPVYLDQGQSALILNILTGTSQYDYHVIMGSTGSC